MAPFTAFRVVKRIIDKAAPPASPRPSPTRRRLRTQARDFQVDVAGHKTNCSLSGSIVRYPPTATMKGGQGEEMVSLSMKSSATADGTTEGSLLDCIEATAENLVTKSVPIMKADYLKR